MNNSDYKKADNTVDNVKNNLKDATENVNSHLDNMAEKAKAYIREQRDKDEEATKEGWLDQVKK
ncbi:hypothetical protein [Halpernia sp.]|uniref:hypothetical protein n=1 Tax=Halpernia sp. TaxID=2782209 RepID=UPI003A8E85E2